MPKQPDPIPAGWYQLQPADKIQPGDQILNRGKFVPVAQTDIGYTADIYTVIRKLENHEP